MLILDSGILLALSLSCGYNFEVWEVEPPCTRVKAETGDKALTSWWAVKLGRNQQMNKIWNSRYLDHLDSLTQYKFIAAIFHMGLLKKVQVRAGHIHVHSVLIMIPSSNQASGFATERKHLAWEFWPGFLSSLPSFSTSIRREHCIIC